MTRDDFCREVDAEILRVCGSQSGRWADCNFTTTLTGEDALLMAQLVARHLLAECGVDCGC